MRVRFREMQSDVSFDDSKQRIGQIRYLERDRQDNKDVCCSRAVERTNMVNQIDLFVQLRGSGLHLSFLFTLSITFLLDLFFLCRQSSMRVNMQAPPEHRSLR